MNRGDRTRRRSDCKGQLHYDAWERHTSSIESSSPSNHQIFWPKWANVLIPTYVNNNVYLTAARQLHCAFVTTRDCVILVNSSRHSEPWENCDQNLKLFVTTDKPYSTR